jgi:hypothetical protein
MHNMPQICILCLIMCILCLRICILHIFTAYYVIKKAYYTSKCTYFASKYAYNASAYCAYYALNSEFSVLKCEFYAQNMLSYASKTAGVKTPLPYEVMVYLKNRLKFWLVKRRFRSKAGVLNAGFWPEAAFYQPKKYHVLACCHAKPGEGAFFF